MPTAITELVSGGTRILLTPIEAGAAGTRRSRERGAVDRLVAVVAPGLTLGHEPSGAPSLAGMFVSVSHSLTHAAVAVDAGRRIGIDVEGCRAAQLERVAHRFLSDDERRLFGSQAMLQRAWAAKEAVFKALYPNDGVMLADISLSADMGRASVRGCDFTVEFYEPVPEQILALAYRQ